MILSRIYDAFICSRKNDSVERCQHEIEMPEEVVKKSWFSAVEHNDVAAVQNLVNQSFGVNVLDKSGWSALHTSAWNGYLELCDLLLVSGADPDLVGPGGMTALCLAAQQGHGVLVHQLLASGCDIRRVVDIDSSRGVTALHLAARNGHVEVVRALVAAGCDVSVTMSTGNVAGLTALHLAVEGGHLDVMDALLGAGSDVNVGTVSCAETGC